MLLGSTWYSLSIWMVWAFCLNDYFNGFSYFFDVGLQMKFLWLGFELDADVAF